MKFKNNFIFGGSTAAYQCEGAIKGYGKGEVAWDDFLKEKGKFNPEPASDFYHEYPIDLKLCHDFGLNGIRISIAWSRIFPNGIGEVNEQGVQYYHQLFKECLDNGVEPFVTLHHFDTPKALFDQGDFLASETIDAFVRYAEFCFDEFKEITYWFTFNEIWAMATNKYIEGTFPGGEKYNIKKAVQLMHNMMIAHAKTVKLFKAKQYDGKIGIIHSLETKYPFEQNDLKDIKAAKNEDVLQNQFLLDATLKGEYSIETLNIINAILKENNETFIVDDQDVVLLKEVVDLNDYLGVNYYQSRYVKHYFGENQIVSNSSGQKGSSVFALKGIGQRCYKEGLKRTDWDWIIDPNSLAEMLLRIKNQYPNYKEIYITENGMGYKDEFKDGVIDDTPRIDYLREHMCAILKAVDLGVNVGGYFVWSLMDMFSWTNGYNKRYGLFYVDYPIQKRYPKASAYWFKSVAESKELK